MTQERFTQLPTVGTSQLTDIICAVQGFVSEPSNLGLSTQQTLQQVYNLFQSTIILYNAGNPNGSVAGTTFQLCWDTVNKLLWICTQTGSSTTAVWTKVIQLVGGSGITIQQNGDSIIVSANGTGISWNAVTTNITMASGNGYKIDTGSNVNLLLPPASNFGDQISIMGFSGGLWRVTQDVAQKIVIGSVTSTPGNTGYIEAANQYDSIVLICMEDNLTWQCLGAPQGNITII